jgi:hypothetical protein
MAESDPYTTSYAEHPLKDSVTRAAAKRNRKVSEARGNKDRQEIEGKAPAWDNEGSTKTSTAPKGSSIPFHPGSYENGLHFNLKKGR